MGLFNRRKNEVVKHEPMVKKNIQQEMIEYAEIYNNPQADDNYIKNAIRPAFGSRFDYDKAKAVLGVIAMAEKNKKLALEKYDTLIKWWLEIDEQSDEFLNAELDIAFFDGLLEANHVVSKQEFSAFHQKNTKIADEMVARKINRLRGKHRESQQDSTNQISSKNDIPLTEQIFNAMEDYLSGFLRNNFSGRGTAFSIGASFGIADAIYRLTAESIKGDDEKDESDITKHTLDALQINRYSNETIESIMKTRLDLSTDYYQKGYGKPIIQVIEMITDEIIEYYSENSINLNYETVRKSLIDYQISVSNAIQTQFAK